MSEITLFMLASKAGDTDLEKIARNLGPQSPSPPGFRFETFTTVDQLRELIAKVSQEPNVTITALDIVAHGSWGTFGIFPDEEILNCFGNKFQLRGIGRFLAPGAEVRLLGCDLAAPIAKAGGWSFDPQKALNWISSCLSPSGVPSKKIYVSAPTVRVPTDLFDHRGFIVTKNVPFLRSK